MIAHLHILTDKKKERQFALTCLLGPCVETTPEKGPTPILLNYDLCLLERKGRCLHSLGVHLVTHVGQTQVETPSCDVARANWSDAATTLLQ